MRIIYFGSSLISLSFSLSLSMWGFKDFQLHCQEVLQRNNKFMSGICPSFAMTFYAAACIILFASFAEAQNQTQTTADPSEVRALNSLFEQWKIKADTEKWNISGEPCSGAAIDRSIPLSSGDYNPFIKCNCSYTNDSFCHIVELKVTEMDVAGPIPEELWTLTYLSNLDLSKNYLSGSLSQSIGNLTRLQYLTVEVNILTGELPKELGNLTDLLSLSVADNHFSGDLPPELGNLLNLQKLYIHSSGVSGGMPSTFANLQNLDTLWASDTELTGKIPDFLGNWSKLKSLRLQGNSFEGPIPLAIGNLTSMIELRVSDLTNGSSSLDFIKSMKTLTVLELRNNNISDSFPLNIGEYQNLKELDLSFNNITGEIPKSLFNMSSLSMLFLGNNKISGALPPQKSTSLTVIDLSYNNLAGKLPSWVNQKKLQLNLVGNNFTAESLNSSGLPSGLECLQQNFPCTLGRGTYYSLAINCGGAQFTSPSGIVYERDNDTLGPATYYVSNSNRWAVSSVGYFTGIRNSRYIIGSAYQFTNTLDSELFQTSRTSASSLRYYGLGLENGEYTVSLQFSETVFYDSASWKNLGRRLFDVYIQGSRVLQNFDIRKEANWITSQAVQREFKAQVSQNYLEIHLFWAGKGTSSVPLEGTYGPSIAAISVTPDFDPVVENIPQTRKKNKTGLITGIVVGAGVLSFLSVFICLHLAQKENSSQTNDDIDLLGIDVRTFTFSYDQLKTATNDFSSSNMLGEGGFGSVYKGILQDGRMIAAKQLSLTSNQGKQQFVTEIATMTAVQHRNLVQLYGCCHEGDHRILIYEYMENNSLDHALFGSKRLALKWSTRFDVCLGVARGLAYLHEESHFRIIHRDVKASNVLLDSDLIPKISDFGLARLYDIEKTHISTRVSGTIGYLAPEYAMYGQLTEKTDVFAFGVLALEIVSGRPNCDMSLEEEKTYLLGWAWNLYKEGRELELVDSALTPEFNEKQARRVIRIALLCTQASPSLRPPMSRVVAMLLGHIQVTNEISTPGYLNDRKFDRLISSISGTTTEGTSTGFYSYSSAGTSMVSDAGQSIVNANQYPVFQDSVREGR